MIRRIFFVVFALALLPFALPARVARAQDAHAEEPSDGGTRPREEPGPEPESSAAEVGSRSPPGDPHVSEHVGDRREPAPVLEPPVPDSGTSPPSGEADREPTGTQSAAPSAVAAPPPQPFGGPADAEGAHEGELLPSGVFWGGVALTVLSTAVGGYFGFTALTLSSAERGRDVRLPPDVAGIEEAALVADVLFTTALVFGVATVIVAVFTDWSSVSEPVAEEESREDPESARVRFLGTGIEGVF